jgi:hypothetical protein
VSEEERRKMKGRRKEKERRGKGATTEREKEERPAPTHRRSTGKSGLMVSNLSHELSVSLCLSQPCV